MPEAVFAVMLTFCRDGDIIFMLFSVPLVERITPMQTLILNGSPRKKGDTASLLQHLRKHLTGEIIEISAYHDNISPCIDCRRCKESGICVIPDKMQDIYKTIETCDNIIIASPIYFSELTGRLLDVASRLQTYYYGMQKNGGHPVKKPKRGAVILVGGGEGDAQIAYDTAVRILHYMKAKEIYPLICSHRTDEIPAAEDIQVLAQLRELAAFLHRD